MVGFGKRNVRIRLTEKLLGTVPRSREIYASYIAGKARDLDNEALAEELQTVDEVEERGWTGFHRDENGLFLYDYLIKGFIKSGLEVCMEMGAVSKITAYKKWVDLAVFVWPRRIYLGVDEPDGVLERPLRTMTAKGPRVALSRSDYVDPGRELSFEVEILKNKKGLDWDAVEQAFDYGRYVGLGQWRGSGGYGRFELVSVDPVEEGLSEVKQGKRAA